MVLTQLRQVKELVDSTTTTIRDAIVNTRDIANLYSCLSVPMRATLYVAMIGMTHRQGSLRTLVVDTLRPHAVDNLSQGVMINLIDKQ